MFLAVLELNVDVIRLIDWSGRRVDSWGISIERAPAGADVPRRLAKRLPESEALGAEINGRNLTEPCF